MAPALCLGEGIVVTCAKVNTARCESVPSGVARRRVLVLPIPARNGSSSSALRNFSGTYRKCAGWADGAVIAEGEAREKSSPTSSAHLTGFSMI